MSLSCGGRGPCCHVGYPHRHCDHCDAVIATYVQPHTHYQWPWYGVSGIYNGNLASQINPYATQLQSSSLFNQLSAGTEVPIDGGQQSSST